MMAAEMVPESMAGAYSAHDGDLAERMLAALDAAQAAGGDVRGRQSAALIVVPAVGERWRTRFDIRVEDDGEPLVELRRLLRLARAYEMAAEADELLAEGEHRAATRRYLGAAELAPEADELTFWAGVGVATDDMERGVELVRRAAAVKPSWLTLLDRLPAELAPDGCRDQRRARQVGSWPTSELIEDFQCTCLAEEGDEVLVTCEATKGTGTRSSQHVGRRRSTRAEVYAWLEPLRAGPVEGPL